MRTVALSWETWRAIIDMLRTKGLPYMVEHADSLERQLEQHPPEDLYLRSFTWARWELDIPLPAEG